MANSGQLARRAYSQGSGCPPDSSLMLWIYLSRLVKGCLGSPTTSGSDVKTDFQIQRRSYTTVSLRVQRTGPNHATLSISARTQPIRQPTAIELELSPTHRRWFHATCRCEAPPLFFWFASVLKSSSVLNLIHTVTRVTMTLVPFTLIKMKIMSKLATKLPEDAPKRADFLEKAQGYRKLILALFIVPFSLFVSALVACLERTPLTGRWRVILMSPQEEDDVSKQLQGTGWYNAVADILLSNSNGSMPKVIPVSDWRYQWVDQTLRKLESYLPVFRDEKAYHQTWFEAAAPDFPVPPPSRFPLVPRPRVSQLLHCFLSESSIDALTGHIDSADAPHVIMGPPYNLLLVEKPEVSNGFSYGFGGNGAAGIVVFSGFLDEILKNVGPAAPAPAPEPKSAWTSMFGFNSAAPIQPPHAVPTPEQTAQLAVLLAHEISHLMLAHHLETLSSSTILAPGVLGIFSDILRTIFFPVTMLLGPFVNDAVANMTSVSRQEIIRGHESCFNRKLEIEADIVSARILAYAGFDPRIAVDFWESRLAPEPGAGHDTHGSSAHFWRGGPGGGKGDTHPMREERIVRLKAELARWEAERQKSRAAAPSVARAKP
ncbi:hypothetical protein AURDEDRAFT_139440 [Auricularia subglabra TFB-10046 SS5]|uniref:Peptidase M48 domain-containing protein n=1 Tax=Auricularia subglabra (strain TFB-10046 / SS5) TaxID=717982 RepID=J0LIQ2_AURST|nr:hypothetical protein AURDEDRAFT_139440 [Auricularia subglabra TFB-10046 SS5]